MLMRYRGGGVGHMSTRSATDKFLQDRDRLDQDNRWTARGDERASDEDGVQLEVDEQLEDSDSVADSGAGNEAGNDDESENELEPQGHDGCDDNDSDDLGGSGSDDGGLQPEGCNEDVEEATGDLDAGEGSGDEEEDYGYGYEVDDDDRDDSDAPPDDADDALGPEDGEGEIDEVNMFGFASF
jgi:hypothetical protein